MAAIIAFMAMAAAALAQVGGFYAGKTIDLIVSVSSGGGYDGMI